MSKHLSYLHCCLTAEVETEVVASDHPQEISLVSWQQPTLKEIIVIVIITYRYET